MKNNQTLKEKLLKQCIAYVNKQLETIQKTIASNKNDLFSETKSSAGDKHETGRAMIQLEMEKAGQQLVVVSEMKKVLERIQINKQSDNVKLGSLVETSKGIYFLAISIGQIQIDEKSFFVVSSQSPIGKQLLGKHIGEIIAFNKAEILEIV